MVASSILALAVSCAHAQLKSPFLEAPKFGPRIFPGELVVTFRPGTDVAATVSQVSARLDELSTRQTPNTLAPHTVGFTIAHPVSQTGQLPSGNIFSHTWQTVKTYRSHPNVLAAEPVYLVVPFRHPNDPEYARMWNYHARPIAPGGANFAGAWQTTVGHRNIRIAVLDTGILPTEPEFLDSRNLVSGIDLVSDSWMANDNDPGAANDHVDYDTDPTDPGDGLQPLECGLYPDRPIPHSWHGSHVSGTAGAGRTNDNNGIAGAVWNATVIPVRVLGRCGGKTTDIAQAIRWAAGYPIPSVPANPHGRADVINLSFGVDVPCSLVNATIQAAINEAVAAGSIVVAAAGNEAQDASNVSPASCDNVITVAASDSHGSLADSYSNYGKPVDLMAPGGDGLDLRNPNRESKGILSVVKDGHEEASGTSMAAPHVTAAIALLLSQNDKIRDMTGPEKVETVRALLRASAVSRTPNQCPRPCGAGLLDAGALLTQSSR